MANSAAEHLGLGKLPFDGARIEPPRRSAHASRYPRYVAPTDRRRPCVRGLDDDAEAAEQSERVSLESGAGAISRLLAPALATRRRSSRPRRALARSSARRARAQSGTS